MEEIFRIRARLKFENKIQSYIKIMLDVSDVRIYGIGAIILILSMGYFVYLLYQDVTFIKKELAEYTSSMNHDYNEEDDDTQEEEEEDDTQEEEDHYHDFVEEPLEMHMDSFMRPGDDSRLYTIDEEVVVDAPAVKKRKGKKQKVDPAELVAESLQEIE